MMDLIIFPILILALTVIWIILPFAIFGIKPLLREILSELRKLNKKNKCIYLWQQWCSMVLYCWAIFLPNCDIM